MIKERVLLGNMNLCDVYKIVYDGMMSRDKCVKDECIRYLKKNYFFFDEEKELNAL